MLPSIQCGLALLTAAKRYNKAFYREIAGLSAGQTRLSVPAVLGVDPVRSVLHVPNQNPF